MPTIFSFLAQVSDPRQPHKIVHTLSDIVMIVFFSHLAKCDSWEDISHFAYRYERILKQVLPLENGIPSKDTIRRVMGMIHPQILNEVQLLWNEKILERKRQEDGRLIAIDGKTMRGNRQTDSLPLHVVSAYSVTEGLCFGQTAVQEKSNEISAIPKLLRTLKLNGQTITIDAMGTQREIAKQIRKQHGHYVLAVKGNQGALYEEVKTYLDDSTFEKQIKKRQGYSQTIESARSQIETRTYYQTEEIAWMLEKMRWTGLKTIGKVVTTIEKAGKTTQETRYYISSCRLDITHFQQAIRGHWGIESMHWHLDVTFGEDSNHTLNKNAAQNLNIIRKMALPILKEMPFAPVYQRASMRSRRFIISMDFPFYLGMFYEMFYIR